MNPDESAKRPGFSPRTKQLLIGFGGVLALLLGALLIYSVLITPEKQPYRDALAQYQQVYDANVAFTNAATGLSGTTGTQQQVQSNTESIETAKANLVAANNALSEAQVLQDGEGKQLYDAFDAKLEAYITHSEGLLASREIVRPVLTSDDCTNALATDSNYASKVAPMQACAKSFKAIKGITDADYRSLVDAYKTNYTKLASVFKSIAALDDPEGDDADREQELIDQHDAILSTIEDANTAFASGLSASKSEVDITATAQALDAYLSDKSSVF